MQGKGSISRQWQQTTQMLPLLCLRSFFWACTSYCYIALHVHTCMHTRTHTLWPAVQRYTEARLVQNTAEVGYFLWLCVFNCGPSGRQQRPRQPLWGAQVLHFVPSPFSYSLFEAPYPPHGSVRALWQLCLEQRADKNKLPHHGLFCKAGWCRCSLIERNQDNLRLKRSGGFVTRGISWFAGREQQL